MEKVTFLTLVVSALAVFALADKVEQNMFIQTFNSLHKEPGPEFTTNESVETLWIKQKLDHFDGNETRSWQMRYMAKKEFYKPGGPLFIFVGGEWAIREATIGSGHVHDLAKEHNGYLFYTEHRFYGESLPVAAMTNENLKYLSVQQALADLAHFVRTMKSTIPGMKNSKVILTGASYSGTMVTWFNKLYPDLATGIWASSAPLLVAMDFYQYKQVMSQSIKLVGGDACNDRIKSGFAELESMVDNKRGAEFKAMLHLCDSFREDNDLDVFSLFYEISELFASFVQKHHIDTIQRSCERIMQGSTDVIGVANFIVDKLFPTKKGCVDFSYRSYLKLYTDPEAIMRPWTYQTCNEFGWFQTSSSRNQSFGTKYPLDFFTTLCADAYGDKFTPEYISLRIKETRTMFADADKAENVHWTHGQLDPWRSIGIQYGEQVTIIPYHSHCKDLGSVSKNDAHVLTVSKAIIADLVRKWLA